MRSDVCNIVNELSEEHAKQARAAGAGFDVLMDFSLKNAYDLVMDFCRKSGTRPRQNVYTMVNGCIKANDQLIGRCAPMINKPGYAKVFTGGVDYEDRILARQEREEVMF